MPLDRWILQKSTSVAACGDSGIGGMPPIPYYEILLVSVAREPKRKAQRGGRPCKRAPGHTIAVGIFIGASHDVSRVFLCSQFTLLLYHLAGLGPRLARHGPSQVSSAISIYSPMYTGLTSRSSEASSRRLQRRAWQPPGEALQWLTGRHVPLARGHVPPRAQRLGLVLLRERAAEVRLALRRVLYVRCRRRGRLATMREHLSHAGLERSEPRDLWQKRRSKRDRCAKRSVAKRRRTSRSDRSKCEKTRVSSRHAQVAWHMGRRACGRAAPVLKFIGTAQRYPPSLLILQGDTLLPF